MSAHTPAPWRVIETNLLPHEGDHVADMSNGLMVVPFCKLGDPLADARLIAAAPDLLAALQKIAEFDEYEPAGPAARTAKAAIRKATGEQA